MKKLTERDMDEIESVKHYLRYVNTNPDSEDYELLDAFYRLQMIGDKYILNGYDEKDFDKLIDVEDMQDLVQKFISRFKEKLNLSFEINHDI